MRYRVQAIRSGGWWAIEFSDVDDRIHSQARRLEQVPEMAADAIAFSLDVDVSPDDIDVETVLPDELEDVVRRARNERAHAADAADSASAALGAAVAAGVRAGLPTRDVGALLGVSHQYVARVGALTIKKASGVKRTTAKTAKKASGVKRSAAAS